MQTQQVRERSSWLVEGAHARSDSEMQTWTWQAQ